MIRSKVFVECTPHPNNYKVRNDRLSFSRIISTKKACVDEGRMQQEQNYFKALGSAGKFEKTDDQLKILYDNGRGTLKFVKAPPSTRE